MGTITNSLPVPRIFYKSNTIEFHTTSDGNPGIIITCPGAALTQTDMEHIFRMHPSFQPPKTPPRKTPPKTKTKK